jgi:hypothetical protein
VEGRPRNACFFFANAAKGLDTILRFGRQKFKHVFGSSRTVKQDASQSSFIAAIGQRHEHRYVELIWLAEDDPLRIEKLGQMPIVEYWNLLNRKLAAAEKLEQLRKKNAPAKPQKRGKRNSR